MKLKTVQLVQWEQQKYALLDDGIKYVKLLFMELKLDLLQHHFIMQMPIYNDFKARLQRFLYTVQHLEPSLSVAA